MTDVASLTRTQSRPSVGDREKLPPADNALRLTHLRPAGGEQGGTRLALRLLGPVEIRAADGAVAAVAQPMQRVLLGLLATARGRTVSTDALIDGLWGEEWSRERERNLQSQVSALRRRLAEAEPGCNASRLQRSGGGYRLVIADDDLDVGLFRQLASDGRQAARAGDAAGAAASFGCALGLWRGSALADAAPLCSRLTAEAASLEELRAGVVEERAECQLALGQHLEAAAELSEHAAEYPGRERLTGLLMVALWRCGRRGDALAAFDRTRRSLAEVLGLDPGPGLRDLHARVLADDPSLVRAGSLAGGARELRAFDGLLDQGGVSDDPGRPAGLVVGGVAGIADARKTALAVQWARRAAGRFADGMLWVDMHGCDADAAPLAAEERISWFLVALGIPVGAVPDGAQERDDQGVGSPQPA